MKLITKNTDYAIRALLHLARNGGEYVSSREISREETIPLPYLRRILQRLREEKLITAREGANGGVKILQEPTEIRISRLIEIFQGDVALLDCVFRKDICSNIKTCPLRRRIKKIEKEVVKELDCVTIESLLDDLNLNLNKGDN
ncbi:MAG TPA: Rrf2 family transcriptional regulator [Proteobacteria bacterium]|nr:Rrf2 family transcriptional regulator [Pseudomonadota bacterium]